MKSLVELVEPIQRVNIVRNLLAEDGTFPNNPTLPLLIYRSVLKLSAHPRGESIIELFESNGWSNAWENGIYDYHHYHSTTHEVIGIAKGSARVQFGGEHGVAIQLEKGDVVIIPAGVAHKKLSGEEEFRCVGAYPDGREYDINTGQKNERPRADENIKELPIPEADPVFGANGPLQKNWFKNKL